MAREKLLSSEVLEAALEGLEFEQQRIRQHIEELRDIVTRRALESKGADGVAVQKRTLDEAARQRIAEGQRRRWAEYRRLASVKDTSDVAEMSDSSQTDGEQ